MPDKEFSIKYLADLLEISTRTLKKWESEGKIPEARRNKWGWRIYNKAEIDKLKNLIEEKKYFVS